jgi:type III secretion system YscQ/HrcQ family protein
LLVRAARREASTPLRVLAAGSAATFARDLAAASGIFVGASFTALVDDDAFLAHVLVARSRATSVTTTTLDRKNLARMGSLSIALPVVAATLTLTAAEVGALRIGDALVIAKDAWSLAGGAGPVVLAAPRGEVAIAAELRPDGQLVLRGEESSLSWSAEKNEEPMNDRDPLVEAVGEVPVVVRVEIGTAELTAREWSQLGPGDVLTVGRRVKEPVSLRVSGVEVARGELVDVEGEVGVRILSLTKGTAS